MKILWHSVAPWFKTGYGSQTEIFCKRIKQRLGHDVAISTWTYQAHMTEFESMPVYPCRDQGFGNKLMPRHAAHWDADLVITLTDAWVFNPASMQKVPWAPWLPVDHDPVPPKVVDVLKRGYAAPIAYSEFGRDLLSREGFEPMYVPHACNQTYFESTSKRAARKNLGFPQGAYIIGMVGVNQSVPNRKSYPQSICAFKQFHKKHKDAFLYLHTTVKEENGLNLSHLCESIGLDPASYRFADQYEMLLGFPEHYLRDVYSAMDVFLSPNMGEGFGIPIIEAQACGAPIIGTNFSTFPELCYFGELIEGEPFYTNQASFQRIPDERSILKGLTKVYNYASDDYKKGSTRAKKMIRKHFHPDTVTDEFWGPVLDSARARIGQWKYPDFDKFTDDETD